MTVRAAGPDDLGRVRRGLFESSRALLPASLRAPAAAHRERLAAVYDERALADAVALALEDGSGVALASEAPNQFDGGAEGFVHALVCDGAGAERELLAAVEAAGRERGWRCLRLRLFRPYGPAPPGWQLGYVRVSKRADADAAAALAASPVLIRTQGAGDGEVVCALVVESLAAALRDFERPWIGPDALAAWARSLVAGATVVVAEEEGRTVAAALADLAYEDDLTGGVEAWLHDTCVPPGLAGRGIGAALAAAVELLAVEAGRELVNATVLEDDPARVAALLGRLAGSGWAQRELVLVRAL